MATCMASLLPLGMSTVKVTVTLGPGVLAAALEGTGGPLTPEEIRSADDVLAGGGEPFTPPAHRQPGAGAA